MFSCEVVEWRCPVCDSETRRIFRVRAGFPIRECPACLHRFAEWISPSNHISTVYADDYFFGGGDGYPDYLSEGDLLRAQARRYARLIAPHMTPGRLLDVGAASGFLCDGFRAEGWAVEGLEPNEAMAHYGRERLGLSISTGALENFDTFERYDLISLIQVLGHFADPRRALEKAAGLTRGDGFWLIETWDCRSLTARAFGKHWHEYSPPGVLHYFSRRSLELLANQLGFDCVASGHPAKRISWGHARSLIADRLSWRWLHSLSSLLPARLVLPYPSEDLLWMLFRKR